MKEIKTIVESIKTIDPNQPLALATVVRVEGSSYRRTGARMLVTDTGRFCGGISGGCLEGDALKHAQKAMLYNESSIVTYDTTQEDAYQVGVGLGCNGIIDVLISPIDRTDEKNPMALLSSVVNTRIPRLLVTITGINTDQSLLGRSFLINEEPAVTDLFPLNSHGSLLADMHACLDEEKSATRSYTFNGSEFRLFMEVIKPAQHLVVFGGNYDVYPILRVARELGWTLTVVTNIHKADKELFRLADDIMHAKPLGEFVSDAYTAGVLMAHDLETDYTNLQRLLATEVSYIGMLGPRKRAEKIFHRLAEDAIELTLKDHDRIFAPAGLDIGAVTPEEIAISIVSEIRARSAGREGMSLRTREGSIHLPR